MFHLNNAPLTHIDRILHNISQLTDIARIVIRRKPGNDGSAEAADIFFKPPAEIPQKMVEQETHIVPPFAKGRQMKTKHVQTVEKVFAEFSLLDITG